MTHPIVVHICVLDCAKKSIEFSYHITQYLIILIRFFYSIEMEGKVGILMVWYGRKEELQWIMDGMRIDLLKEKAQEKKRGRFCCCS